MFHILDTDRKDILLLSQVFGMLITNIEDLKKTTVSSIKQAGNTGISMRDIEAHTLISKGTISRFGRGLKIDLEKIFILADFFGIKYRISSCSDYKERVTVIPRFALIQRDTKKEKMLKLLNDPKVERIALLLSRMNPRLRAYWIRLIEQYHSEKNLVFPRT